MAKLALKEIWQNWRSKKYGKIGAQRNMTRLALKKYGKVDAKSLKDGNC